MAQIKIYGLKTEIDPIKSRLSDAIHSALVAELALPIEKRFHRFLTLDDGDFLFPADRSRCYIILEISMFEGRTVETKKRLIRALFRNLKEELGIEPQDVEVTIFETPRHNWGIRGEVGDELGLNYKVEV